MTTSSVGEGTRNLRNLQKGWYLFSIIDDYPEDVERIREEVAGVSNHFVVNRWTFKDAIALEIIWTSLMPSEDAAEIIGRYATTPNHRLITRGPLTDEDGAQVYSRGGFPLYRLRAWEVREHGDERPTDD